jgi:glycosyltransferase involved in cell wall biosynthesis
MDEGVSVVLPTYNRAASIGRAVTSVLSQTHQHLELIVVDDGSTDETCQVVSSIRDDRVRLIRHSQNLGPSAARNTGVAAASFPLIAFQDSDDSWRPEKLARQVRALCQAEPGVGVVFSQLALHEGLGKTRVVPKRLTSSDSEVTTRSLLWANIISTQTAVVRRPVLDAVGGFDEELRALVDWELWIRISQGFGFLMVGAPLVDVERSPVSITTDKELVTSARAYIIKKHEALFLATRDGKNLLSRQQRRVGTAYIGLGHASLGRRFLRESLRTHPSLSSACFLVVSWCGQYMFSRVAPYVLRVDRSVSRIMKPLLRRRRD